MSVAHHHGRMNNETSKWKWTTWRNLLDYVHEWISKWIVRKIEGKKMMRKVVRHWNQFQDRHFLKASKIRYWQQCLWWNLISNFWNWINFNRLKENWFKKKLFWGFSRLNFSLIFRFWRQHGINFFKCYKHLPISLIHIFFIKLKWNL